MSWPSWFIPLRQPFARMSGVRLQGLSWPSPRHVSPGPLCLRQSRRIRHWLCGLHTSSNTACCLQDIERAFKNSRWGRALDSELAQPFQGSERQMRSLVTRKYGLPWHQAFKACLGREWRLFYRNSFAFYSSTFQVGFLLFANGDFKQYGGPLAEVAHTAVCWLPPGMPSVVYADSLNSSLASTSSGCYHCSAFLSECHTANQSDCC